MSNNVEDLSAVDFLLFMDNPESSDTIRQEYHIIKQNRRKSYQESDDEPDNKWCRDLLCRFFCCIKKEEEYSKANIIDCYDLYSREQKYICVSDPQVEDCEKFWKLAWYHEVTTIVNISHEKEGESYRYWSPNEGNEMEYGKFRVKTLIVIKRHRFISTVLQLSDHKNFERLIWHYHYTAWPTDNNEVDPLMFLSFVCSLNDTYACYQKKQPLGWTLGAILVHCNDSSSSSAVYCILDNCVTQFKGTGTVSVANTFQKMQRRARSIKFDADDYNFCYQAIRVYVLGEMGMNQEYLNERELARFDTLWSF